MTSALLLVGHGSRDPAAAREMTTLVGLVRARTPDPVAHGWIELEQPAAADAGLALLRQEPTVDRLVLVPLLLFDAYHARTDVPGIAEVLRGVHPGVRVRVARPLGIDARLVRLAAARIEAVGGPGDALVVGCAGSSDPDAQAAAATAARVVAERVAAPVVAHAFAASAVPDPGAAVASVATGGGTVTWFSWSLLAGRLASASLDQARAAATLAGTGLRDAGRLGPDPAVADVLVARYRESLA